MQVRRIVMQNNVTLSTVTLSTVTLSTVTLSTVTLNTVTLNLIQGLSPNQGLRVKPAMTQKGPQ